MKFSKGYVIKFAMLNFSNPTKSFLNELSIAPKESCRL